MAVPYFSPPYMPNYPSPYTPQPTFNQFGTQQMSQNGLIIAWVQGEQAMKSFAMGPNQKAFLFNTEENNFGIKTTDANGMPNPLEVFAYHRIDDVSKQTAPAQPAINTSDFVTRDEFENRFLEIMVELENRNRPQNDTSTNKGDNKHGK
jgi:hypothetical protein